MELRMQYFIYFLICIDLWFRSLNVKGILLWDTYKQLKQLQIVLEISPTKRFQIVQT